MGGVFDVDATPDELLRDHHLAYPDMDASPTFFPPPRKKKVPKFRHPSSDVPT